MASYKKEDWLELASLCKEAGFDIVELNLSCNHGMPDKGMGRACSDDPDIVAEIVRWCVSVLGKTPVFVKISPNSSITEKIAESTLKAGGKGISCTNTMFSFMDADGGRTPYPAVGANQHVYFGGAAGAILRPIALRIATVVSQQIKDIPIMATGGIISSEHVMNYLRFGGCSVFQVCSAVQEYDFALTVNDLSTGLKALLYLEVRHDLRKKGWVGQSPPVTQAQVLRGEYKNTFDFWQKGEQPQVVRPEDIPSLASLKGKGHKHVEQITKMDIAAQKFPVINESLCVNCGKCYLTCLDSGYQAISFNKKDHKPRITADCTGCGLCFAVCPVPGALLYEPRPADMPYTPQRGDKYF